MYLMAVLRAVTVVRVAQSFSKVDEGLRTLMDFRYNRKSRLRMAKKDDQGNARSRC